MAPTGYWRRLGSQPMWVGAYKPRSLKASGTEGSRRAQVSGRGASIEGIAGNVGSGCACGAKRGGAPPGWL